MTFRYVDLFSGAGGFALAMKGIAKPVMYCEIDPNCQKALRANMKRGFIPSAPVHDDVKTLAKSKIPKANMVVGGWPCVAFSNIGHGEGFANPAAALLYDMLHVVDAVDPQIILFENVAAIVSRGLREFTRHVKARGYEVAWTTIHAYAVGLPHNRHRWFALAYKPESGSLQKLRRLTANISVKPAVRLKNCTRPRMTLKTQQEYNARWQMLGNAIVPDCARMALRFILVRDTSDKKQTNWNRPPLSGMYDSNGKLWSLPELQYDKLQLSLTLLNFDTGKRSIERTARVARKDIILWGTPRRSCGCPQNTLTQHACNDLPSQLRFEAKTPQKLKMGQPNIEWVEHLMGYPAGFTNF